MYHVPQFDIFSRQLIKPKESYPFQVAHLPEVIESSTRDFKIVSKLALSYMKAKRRNIHKFGLTFDAATNTGTEHRDFSQQEYSFLAYAREFWLNHTRERYDWNNVNEEDSKVRYSRLKRLDSMFYRLTSGEMPTVDLPWTREEWLSFDDKIMEWTIDNHHEWLLEYSINSHMETIYVKQRLLLLKALSQTSDTRLLRSFVNRSYRFTLSLEHARMVAFLAAAVDNSSSLSICLSRINGGPNFWSIDSSELRGLDSRFVSLKFLKNGDDFIAVQRSVEIDGSWALLTFAAAFSKISTIEQIIRLYQSSSLVNIDWESAWWCITWFSAFREAACRERFEVMDMLVDIIPATKFGSHTTSGNGGWSPLCYAFATGHRTVYNRLINLGWSVDAAVFNDGSALTTKGLWSDENGKFVT